VAAGFIGQQTLFAGVIGPLAAPAILTGMASPRLREKIALVSTGLLICSAVVITHTRAVLLGLGIAFVTGTMTVLFSKQKEIRNFMFRAGTALLSILMVFCILMPTFRSRIVEGIQLKSASIRARFHYWECTWELIREKPLTGWGWGAFPVVYTDAQIKIRTDPGYRGHQGDEIVTHPHNEFLMVTAEGGLAAVTPCLVFIVALLLSGFRKSLGGLEPKRKLTDLGYSLGLVVFTVDMIFSFPFHVGTSALTGIVMAALLTRANPDTMMNGTVGNRNR
jgi:O-antigen ligase